MLKLIPFILLLVILPSCAPNGRLNIERITDSYFRDEGFGLSGYTKRNADRTVKIKIGEISKDLIYDECGRRPYFPEYPFMEEDLKEYDFILGVYFEKRF